MVEANPFFHRGPIRDPNYFHARQRETNQVLEMLCKGQSISILGPRRMGKTSVARELGRRLESDGWVFLFTDVEDATCPEDVIADIAEAVHPVRPISSRFATGMRRLFSDNVEEISALATKESQ